MTRFGPSDVKRWAQRGQVSKADAQRVLGPARRGGAITRESEPVERVPLAEPIEFGVPMELLTANKLLAMNPYHRGRLVKEQRSWVMLAWCGAWRNVLFMAIKSPNGYVGLKSGRRAPTLPVIVTMTRIGRHMDGHDSLAAAFKHVTDEITVQLALTNDDTPEVTWRYEQEPPAGRHPSIKIRVEAR